MATVTDDVEVYVASLTNVELAAALIGAAKQARERGRALVGTMKGNFATWPPSIQMAMLADSLDWLAKVVVGADLLTDRHLPRASSSDRKVTVAGEECELLIGGQGKRGLSPDDWVRVARAVLIEGGASPFFATGLGALLPVEAQPTA